MKVAVLARLKRLETVRAVEESDRPLKVEFAYLKLLPCDYEGPRHIVSVSQRPDGSVSQRPDGRCEYEERPCPPAPNQSEGNDENVMTIYFVRAQKTGSETS